MDQRRCSQVARLSPVQVERVELAVQVVVATRTHLLRDLAHRVNRSSRTCSSATPLLGPQPVNQSKYGHERATLLVWATSGQSFGVAPLGLVAASHLPSRSRHSSSTGLGKVVHNLLISQLLEFGPSIFGVHDVRAVFIPES